MATPTKEIKKALPQPNSDFYQLVETLPADELAVVKQVRTFMETKVQPIITKYWVEDSFRLNCLPAIKELNLGGVGLEGYGCRGGGGLLAGLVAMEMGRIDASISTFFGVHSGLAMSSIYYGGSEEQKQKWLPPMARMEKIGCFGLTEPLVGSGSGGGLLTTAKREGDTWMINGQKKWIGNATWCDISIIWTRDLADNQVKGFIVENKTTPGFKVEKIQNKIALKAVQNGLITMENCRVPEENRLQEDKSFRDTAKVLRGTRYFVGWEATGCAMGAYENALKYAQERLQFGKPIGSFQLVQDLLSRMLANITARAVPAGSPGSIGGRRENDRCACGAFEGLLHGQVPRDGGLGPGAIGRKRHRRRLQRGALLHRRRSALHLRRHVPNAEPDSRQGHYRPQRFRVSPFEKVTSGSAEARSISEIKPERK